MTWSKAVENNKAQKELLEMYLGILFQFRVFVSLGAAEC